MRNWLNNLGYKLQRFMQGRYGYDELSRFLCIAALVILLLSYIPLLRFLYVVAWILVLWAFIRSFSKDIYKRQMERQKYLAIQGRIKQQFTLWKNIWRDRKTHRYYKCANCKAVVRIVRPERGKTITIQCPKCGQEIRKRT